MRKAQHLSLAEVADIARRVLSRERLSARHLELVVDAIVAGERDECASHGLYRLPGIVRTIRAGKASRSPEPKVQPTSSALVRVDGDGGFAQVAFDAGRPVLEQLARESGLAALLINHCVHFAALWPEVEALARAGFVVLACTPSQAFVAPAGGSRPVLGTNPLAFGWPRPNDPFVFDFATSAIARGDIELHARAGATLPEGWAIDAEGQPTCDAAKALEGAMLTFGGHKGSALAIMIELLAGPLIGDLTSLEALAFDAGAGALPYGGELIIALDPKRILAVPEPHLARAETLFESITAQGARLPSQRRYDARRRTPECGVFVPDDLYREVMGLLEGDPLMASQL